MSTFYCIVHQRKGLERNPNFTLLKEACEKRGVTFEVLLAPEAELVFEEVPELKPGGLYLLHIQASCYQYLFALIKKNPHIKHLYTPRISVDSQWEELIADEAAGVPIIPTLYTPSSSEFDKIKDDIEQYLEGFPVVIKQSGGSHGTGIMYVDSEISLKTLLPHIVSENSRNFVIKKFIKDARHYRLVVLNQKVISTIEYRAQEGDIRTNAVKNPDVVPVTLSEELKQIAVKAVDQKGTVFGGVDLLLDKNDQPFIAEVNTPCNFSRNQHLTHDPIAESIVDYLCSDM